MTGTLRSSDTAFVGNIPELYERVLVPIFFAEPAARMAAAVAALAPTDVLETAAGTGILTRAIDHVGGMRITATDLNEPMLQAGRASGASTRVTWKLADALDLPFEDGSFDVVVCQFGAMFFPDRIKAYSEAHRVLRPGGTFLHTMWGRLEDNAVARIVHEALRPLAGKEPLDFLARTPYGHADRDVINDELRAAGFSERQIDTLDGHSRCTAVDGAVAVCQGTPLRSEIEGHPTLGLDEATAVAEGALRAQYGPDVFDAPMQWLQVSARRTK